MSLFPNAKRYGLTPLTVAKSVLVPTSIDDQSRGLSRGDHASAPQRVLYVQRVTLLLIQPVAGAYERVDIFLRLLDEYLGVYVQQVGVRAKLLRRRQRDSGGWRPNGNVCSFCR